MYDRIKAYLSLVARPTTEEFQAFDQTRARAEGWCLAVHDDAVYVRLWKGNEAILNSLQESDTWHPFARKLLDAAEAGDAYYLDAFRLWRLDLDGVSYTYCHETCLSCVEDLVHERV